MELAARHGWVIGFMDEVWWSRFALPGVHVWSDRAAPGRIVEQSPARADPDAKALACYGIWWAEADQMLLRFVTGRPVSHVTTAFLDWACAELARQGQRVLVLIWDNASWHISAEVRTWIAAHNATAKQTGHGMRILVAGLPTKSPWLNKIEPKWKHGKSAIVEMDGTLSAAEVEERVCAYFGAAQLPRLVQQPPPEKVPKPQPGSTKSARLAQRPSQEAQTQQAA
jgi:DDE superfamily endonuclease